MFLKEDDPRGQQARQVEDVWRITCVERTVPIPKVLKHLSHGASDFFS